MTAIASETGTASTSRWFDKLPTPTSRPTLMSVEDLRYLLDRGVAESVIVVDVRRADVDVCGQSGKRSRR